MGRSRRRQQRSPAAVVAPAPAAPAPDRRRVLVAYLAGAVVLAIAGLAGTLLLAGALGPWVVLAFVGGAGAALHAWATGRLADAALSDEERILQTMAGGLLVLVVGFALVAAVLLTVL